MMIIGIDPGISGSICFFQDGIIKDVIEMPTMTDGKKNKRQVNGAQIFNEISERINKLDKKNIKVVIEQVSAMPGQGVTSMFNFGQSFGILKGICSAMHLPEYAAQCIYLFIMLGLLSGKNILTLLIQKKMRAEQELLKFFHIFHHNCQKKKITTRQMLF